MHPRDTIICMYIMKNKRFNPLPEEWWHFTLKDEPYPDTFFTFPVNSDLLRNGE